jgi:hypothetical protein
MTYEEFLNIPVSVLKDLQTILILKDKHNMDITEKEENLCRHISKYYGEQIKSYELFKNKEKLEKLFRK